MCERLHHRKSWKQTLNNGNAAAIPEVGGKHQTLQEFDLINIWTAVEVRQTKLRQSVRATQLASISWRKHVFDERKIRPRQFIWNMVIPSSSGITTLSELTAKAHPCSDNTCENVKKSLFLIPRRYLSSFTQKDHFFDLVIATICFTSIDCML